MISERDLFYLEAINAQGLGDRIAFKISDVETILGVPKDEIIELISSGKLKCKKFSGSESRWRVSVQWILDFHRKYSTPGE